LVEWLRVTDILRAQIRTGDMHGIKPQPALEESARELLRQGLSNQTEIQRVLGL
jgi:hypothetical protein